MKNLLSSRLRRAYIYNVSPLMAIFAFLCVITPGAVAQVRSAGEAAAIAVAKRAALIGSRSDDGSASRSRAYSLSRMEVTGSSGIIDKLLGADAGGDNAVRNGGNASKSSAASKRRRSALTRDGDAFYICRDRGEGGFVVVAADERMGTVLAYSLTGSLDPDSLSPAAKAFLLGYAIEKHRLQGGASIEAAAKSPALSLTGEGVSPLISTTWGQNYPYNALCPYYDGQHRAVTGCVATTMAQGMNYYKYPARGTGSHSYTTQTYGISMQKDFSATTFLWDQLQSSYSSSVSQDAAQAIGELMLACGVSVDMDYDVESGASQTAQVQALHQYFGYDQDMAIARKDFMPLLSWHTLLIKELDAARPLMISGRTPSGYGHAFLIDGYTPDDDDYPYYHVNWGWRGSGNGNYKMTHLSDSQNGDEVYSEQLAAIINFQPDNGVEDYPCYLQIASVEAEQDQVDATKGESLTLDITQCINGSIKPFTGTVTIYLTDSTGARTPLHTLNLKDMNSAYYFTGTETCAIPNALPSGTYTLCATAQPSGSSAAREVEIGSIGDSIRIINDANVYYPSLMATHITTTHSGSATFSASAEQVCNFAEQAFSGRLQMMITDRYGEFVRTFGPARSISSLSNYNYLTSPFSFSGSLTPRLQDGAYRIGVGACQDGYQSWAMLKKYVIENNMITSSGLDATTPFWVSGGRITLTCPYIEGDANQDNTLNVADLAALIRMILNNYSDRDFAFFASDLDENARLNVADFSLLVPKVLESSQTSSAAASGAFYKGTNTASGALINLSGALIGHDGGSTLYRVDINLKDAGERFNALQFDLNCGEGVELLSDSIRTAARTRGFSIRENGGRVIVYNLQDADISEGEGAVLSLSVRKNNTAAGVAAPLELKSIVLSRSADCSALYCGDAAAVLDKNGVRASDNVPTGLNSALANGGLIASGGKGAIEITASKAATLYIYNVDGQVAAVARLEPGNKTAVSLPAGIYVVAGKKVIVR